MTDANYFFLIFLGTIIVTRLFLLFNPIASPTLKGVRTHHYMYGIIIVIIGIFLKESIVYAIGLGLIVDQLPYLITEREPFGDSRFNKDIYWRKKDLVLLLIFIILVFLFKDWILFF